MVDHTRMDLADDARHAVGRRRIRDRARRRTSPSRCLKHTLPGAMIDGPGPPIHRVDLKSLLIRF